MLPWSWDNCYEWKKMLGILRNESGFTLHTLQNTTARWGYASIKIKLPNCLELLGSFFIWYTYIRTRVCILVHQLPVRPF